MLSFCQEPPLCEHHITLSTKGFAPTGVELSGKKSDEVRFFDST